MARDGMLTPFVLFLTVPVESTRALRSGQGDVRTAALRALTFPLG